MNNSIFKLLLVSLMYIQYACENKNVLTLGEEFIETDVKLAVVDTFTVKLSTLKLDSLETSGNSIALVGGYADALIGSVRSTSYMRITTNTNNIDETAIYDSLVFELIPSGYYYGDTLSSFHLMINRVIEDIELEENTDYLYNTSHFDFEQEPLGVIDFSPRPKEKRTIRIPVSNSLGIELIQKLKSKTDAFEDIGGFTNFFKGIVLRSDNNTNSILGFSVADTSISMKLYYHLEGYETVNSVQFTPISTNLQFNKINSVNSNSILDQLSDKPIDSEKFQNNSYVQAGTGIITKINLPSINNLLLDIDDVPFELVQAKLIIQPSVEMDPDYLPSDLNLYATNKHNDFLTQVTDSVGTVQDGSLSKDLIYSENTTYSWDVTYYLRNILQSRGQDYNGFLVLPENYKSTFDYVVIADPKKSHYRTRLILYLFYL